MVHDFNIKDYLMIKKYLRNKILSRLDLEGKIGECPPIMYSTDTSVNNYDFTKIFAANEYNTLSSATDHNCIEYILKRAGNRVRLLDLGCGAGAFYLAAKSIDPTIEYVGVDISSSQIERARSLFDAKFVCADISELTVDFLKQFDVIHMYSVLNFLPLERQKILLENLIKSGVDFFTDVTCAYDGLRGTFENQFSVVNGHMDEPVSHDSKIYLHPVYYGLFNQLLRKEQRSKVSILRKKIRVPSEIISSKDISIRDFVISGSFVDQKDLKSGRAEKLLQKFCNRAETIFLYPKSYGKYLHRKSRKEIFDHLVAMIDMSLIRKI